MHPAESSPDDIDGPNKGTEATDRRLAEHEFVLSVEEITKPPQAANRDALITEQIAEAVDRGLDIRKWIVALIKLIGWRQALFLLAGFGGAWALAYFGVLPAKPWPHSKAELALNRFHIEAIESRDDATASPPTDFIANAKSYVLISGFSASRTVENNPDTLKKRCLA